MNRRKIINSLALALPILLGATACSSIRNFVNASLFDEESGSLGNVDDFLSRIERVHVDSELSKERAMGAVNALQVLVGTDFGGNPVLAYDELVLAIEASEEQADTFRSSVGAMETSAHDVFEQWARDLEAFANASMRRRSQARLEDTRKRYATILAAAEPAQWEYDALNLGLQDLAVFMGHDLNSSSLAAISEEVQMLADQYVELDKRFVEVMSTAGEYVQSAALPGQFEGPAPEEPVEKIGG